jgi:tetratricopeptide (TPR) repeat protein
MSRRTRSRALIVSGLSLVAAAAIALVVFQRFAPRSEPPTPSVDPSHFGEIPAPDATDMEPPVARFVNETRRAVLENPGSVEAWGRFGTVLDAHELFLHAEPCYRVAHESDPSAFRWAYALARVLEINGAPPEEVFSHFEKARELNPTYAPMLVRYGDALTRGGRHSEAADVFGQAVASDPEFARAHRGLGQALLSVGEAEAAVKSLETAAVLSPEDGATHAALARAYVRTGDRAAARLAQEKARGLERIHSFSDPVLAEVSLLAVSADACLRRAAELMRAGDHRRAIRELKIAEETRSENADFQARLGTAYEHVGRTDLAVTHLKRALQLRPEFPEAHQELGNVLMLRGNPARAIVHYLTAEESRPEDLDLKARLAGALAQQGELAAALAKFEEASRAGPLDARAENNWGSALAQSGRIAEATRHFEEALRQVPRFANAHFNLGVALEDLGEQERAIQHYRRAVEIDPNHRAGLRLRAISDAMPEG